MQSSHTCGIQPTNWLEAGFRALVSESKARKYVSFSTSNSRVDKPNRQSIPFAHLAKQQPAGCIGGGSFAMLKLSHMHPWMVILAILASVSFMAPSGTAQSSPAPPQIGSPNTVTADPPVSRPRTQPCVVQLFTNVRFADFSPKSFSYAPPADCPGPWAKVVFEGDFSVTAGRQFDRTANIWIGGADIYFRATPQPPRGGSPPWHAGRGFTDDTRLFTPA